MRSKLVLKSSEQRALKDCTFQPNLVAKKESKEISENVETRSSISYDSEEIPCEDQDAFSSISNF